MPQEDFGFKPIEDFGFKVVGPVPNRRLPTGDITGEGVKQLVGGAAKFLPFALGTAGVVAAGPGFIPGVVGAALGTAGGRAAELGVRSQTAPETMPESFGEGIKEVVESGVRGGTEQILGYIPAKVISGAAKLLRFTPEGLYRSAVKRTPAAGHEAAEEMAGTLLKEKVPITPEAFQKIYGDQGIVPQLLDKQRKLLASANAANVQAGGAGVMVDVDAALAQVARSRGAFSKLRGPEIDALLNDIRANYGEFVPGPQGQMVRQSGMIPLEEAQKLKSQAYFEAGAYGEQQHAVGKEVWKDLGRGLKTKIEEAVAPHGPELQQLNERIGDLLDAKEPFTRALAREGNRQVTPFFAPVGAAGAAAGGHPGAAGAMMGMDLLRRGFETPEAKSQLALYMQQMQNNPFIRGTRRVINLPTAARAAGEIMFK